MLVGQLAKDKLVSRNYGLTWDNREIGAGDKSLCVTWKNVERDEREAEEGSQENKQGGGVTGDQVTADGREPQQCGGIASAEARAPSRGGAGSKGVLSAENLRQYKADQSHCFLLSPCNYKQCQ